MNLTCTLVLTTMFINGRNNLPKSYYIKKVDVCLLFNMNLPSIVVSMHTYMDTLRNDEEREINHHGKTIQINEEAIDNFLAHIYAKSPVIISPNTLEGIPKVLEP